MIATATASAIYSARRACLSGIVSMALFLRFFLLVFLPAGRFSSRCDGGEVRWECYIDDVRVQS